MFSKSAIEAEIEISEEKVDVGDGVRLNSTPIICVLVLDLSQDA